MTFDTSLTNFTNSSDANFRAWGEYLSDRFTQVGITKTADTGQIDWTTVLAPGAINTYMGYEIRQFTDALQATAPVFLRIDFGAGDSSLNNPGIRITIGTGSNGSGTITGTTTTFDAEATAAAGSTPVWGSGSTNRFNFIAEVSAGLVFSIERTKDPDGNVNALGIYGFSKTGSSNSGSGAAAFLWDRATGLAPNNPTTSSSCFAALFPVGTTFAYGAQVGVAPIFPEVPLFLNPITNIVGTLTANFALGSQFSCYMYGNPINYRVPASSTSVVNPWSGAFTSRGSGTRIPAFRYD